MQRIPMCSKLNVLLREELKNFARRASPQIVDVPYQVKYLKGDTLQTFNLQAKYMMVYDAKLLVWVEHMLRTTRFFDQVKREAAELIQLYCERRIPRYKRLQNKLKDIRPLPVRPEGGSSGTERVLDAELHLAMKVIDEELEEGEIRDEETTN